MITTVPDSNATVSRTAWMVVLLLMPVALLNYLDRQMLATMKSSMVADIPSIANKSDWGLVMACFKWTYAVLSPFGGYIADRFSRRHIIAGSLLVWSAVTWWTGHVTTFNELVAARAIMGISEAFYIPTALALIADYHYGSTRSTAIGLHQTGIYIGQILGGFAGYVAESPEFGWRWMFNACGIMGVSYSVPLFLLLRNRAASDELPHEISTLPSQKPPFQEVFRGLLGSRNFRLLVLYFTLPAIAGWVVRDWMPDILKEKFSLGQGRAGVTAILYVQVASLIGALIGGILADRWMRTSARGRIFTSAIGMTMFLPALFTVGNAQILPAAIAGLIVFGIGWGLFDCNNMPILCQIAKPQWRATGYGIMNLVSISCGGFGDWVFGKLRDHEVPLNVIFGVFSGIALLSVVVVLFIRPSSEHTLQEQSQ